ncbi:MAG TPA: SDR family NAD(P)-dependent oxidoreductase [Polyangia bacterium]|jgi:short-subunit dehydrogenase|nr:SDR family NAD(P)-dependent oxidoreductase [Polyangia bacterium]
MSRPIALVTGASAGIGQSFAAELARAGHDLIVVARRRDRLEALAQRLNAEHKADVQVMVADLATVAGVDAVAARAAAAPVDLIVNNAGFGGYRRFVDLDPRVADELLSVHIRAVVQVTRAALPGMIQRDRGGVVNVASLLALSGSAPAGNFMPQRAVYAGAKAFLLTFTQILATELASTKVRVQVCLPGIVKTEFHEVQGFDTSKMPPRMNPDDVARASLAALARGEVVCVPALEDASALQRIDEAQRAVMAVATTPTLASRYR